MRETCHICRIKTLQLCIFVNVKIFRKKLKSLILCCVFILLYAFNTVSGQCAKINLDSIINEVERNSGLDYFFEFQQNFVVFGSLNEKVNDDSIEVNGFNVFDAKNMEDITTYFRCNQFRYPSHLEEICFPFSSTIVKKDSKLTVTHYWYLPLHNNEELVKTNIITQECIFGVSSVSVLRYINPINFEIRKTNNEQIRMLSFIDSLSFGSTAKIGIIKDSVSNLLPNILILALADDSLSIKIFKQIESTIYNDGIFADIYYNYLNLYYLQKGEMFESKSEYHF